MNVAKLNSGLKFSRLGWLALDENHIYCTDVYTPQSIAHNRALRTLMKRHYGTIKASNVSRSVSRKFDRPNSNHRIDQEYR
jgi:hypothetical protein